MSDLASAFEIMEKKGVLKIWWQHNFWILAKKIVITQETVFTARNFWLHSQNHILK